MSEFRLGPGREFDRIRGILARLGGVAAGVGDDCAVIPEGGGRLVVSVDQAVEQVHFRRDWLTLEEVGWRSAAGALSDLAAEGAETVGVLAAVAMPRTAEEEDVVALMAGIGAATREAGGAVLGGDLSAAERWAVSLTVIGRAERLVTRRGAVAGDGLWVTGTLGGARAALEAWRRGRAPSAAARAAFAHPSPRIRAGVALARAGAHAMIDLSDGLGGDAAHLAAASDVRLDIDLGLLPLGPGVTEAARADGLEAAHFAALGGEDYELLAAMPAAFAAGDAARVARETGLGLTRIGTVSPGTAAWFTLDGKAIALQGYNHFA
jgi:thiamine-monophosphate kinase